MKIEKVRRDKNSELKIPLINITLLIVLSKSLCCLNIRTWSSSYADTRSMPLLLNINIASLRRKVYSNECLIDMKRAVNSAEMKRSKPQIIHISCFPILISHFGITVLAIKLHHDPLPQKIEHSEVAKVTRIWPFIGGLTFFNIYFSQEASNT